MGFGFTPPCLAPTTAGPVILRGVNYASAGSGILNITAKIFGGRINFDARIDNFANTRHDIITLIGAPARLFNLGARKIVVANVAPIGYIPNQRDTNPVAGNGWVTFPNQLEQLFNTQLKSLISELSTNLEGFQNPSSSCYTVAGRFGGLFPCGPTSKVCWDRSKFVFWDAYHPSDTANMIITKCLLVGGFDDISPMNIQKLAQS